MLWRESLVLSLATSVRGFDGIMMIKSHRAVGPMEVIPTTSARASLERG